MPSPTPSGAHGCGDFFSERVNGCAAGAVGTAGGIGSPTEPAGGGDGEAGDLGRLGVAGATGTPEPAGGGSVCGTPVGGGADPAPLSFNDSRNSCWEDGLSPSPGPVGEGCVSEPGEDGETPMLGGAETGNGFLATAGRTSAVTHTGVWSLEAE